MSFTWLSKSLSLETSLLLNFSREVLFNVLLDKLAAYSKAADKGVRIWCAREATIFPNEDNFCKCPIRCCNCRVSVKSVSTISCPGSFSNGVIDNLTFRPSYNDTSCPSSACGLNERAMMVRQSKPSKGSPNKALARLFDCLTNPLPSITTTPAGIT